jgi:hypothetical protein
MKTGESTKSAVSPTRRAERLRRGPNGLATAWQVLASTPWPSSLSVAPDARLISSQTFPSDHTAVLSYWLAVLLLGPIFLRRFALYALAIPIRHAEELMFRK